MKKTFICCLMLILFSQHSLAETTKIALEKAPINRDDFDSIKRGAKTFAGICMACHTMVYMRYNKLAKEAGVVYERMPINVKAWPLNVTPPDLSLIASIRGVDWIYTYLHSFYMDPARPTGVNNLLFPNTAMSGILVPLQGQQLLVPDAKITEKLDHELQWYDVLELQAQGTMTPQQYDAMVADVVNFLAYAAEPYQVEQRKIGKWVMAFMLVFFFLAWLLKKEYWKDVH